MRKKKKKIRPRIEPGFKRQDLPYLILSGLFIFGLVLMVWEIFLFRRTIISVYIPLAIWLTPGLILTPFFFRRLNAMDRTMIGWIPIWILHYVLHTCITGGALMFSFIAINYYGADSEVTSERFEILEKRSHPGRKGHRSECKPVAEIDYHGFRKEIVFSFDDTERFQKSSIVALHVRKGYLGYDILDYQELILTDW